VKGGTRGSSEQKASDAMSKLLLNLLKEQFGDAVLETSSFRGDDVALLTPEVWKSAAKFLRDDPRCGCDYFVDLSAVDFPDRSDEEGGRFEVYLIVYSVANKHRIRIKTRVSEAGEVDTLSDVYAGTNWMEREVYDMFGVKFRGHPDLRRILLYDEFEGFPLRKDYPANKAQPLVPYREGTFDKLGPFLSDEGMPLNRSPMPDTGENR
jgi:NADH-quinone oxidoreductase subunit C